MHKRFLTVLALWAFALTLLFASVAAAQNNDRDNGPTQSCILVINIIDNDQYINQGDIRAGVIQYISQRLNISPVIVQNCIQEITEDDDRNDDNGNNNRNNAGGTGGGGTGIVGADEIAGVGAEDILLRRGDEVLADTIPGGTLPFTGGPSLPFVGGVLLSLVAAILAGRVIRR